MPIKIVNVTKNDKVLDDTAIHDYEIYVNQEFICAFKHRRDRGLGQCLLSAGWSVLKSGRPITTPKLKEMPNG